MTGRDDDSLGSFDELVEVLRAHEGPPHPVRNGATARARGRRLRQAAMLAAAVAIALLIGSAFGFGLGSSVTPSGTARASVVGFGFVPARGWNVVQSGVLGPSGEARAIAANVPLDSADERESTPLATLASLPARGVVIVAMSTPRGDPGEDFKFYATKLPLTLEGSLRPSNPVLPGRSVGQRRIRVGIGGYNVDAWIYFGTAKPTAAALAAAQSQLNRLVVASERVTIAARPAVAPEDKPVTLFGSVDNGRAGESVEIQAKECGHSFFRGAQGATTVDGGGWSTEYYPLITTTLRAVWNGTASGQVTVRKRAMVHLTPKPSARNRFTVWIVAQASFWRKRVVIQRRDQRLGTWRALRTVVLTEQSARGGTGPAGFSANATLDVPRGTLLRAVVPRTQARPCYLSGTSLPVRT